VQRRSFGRWQFQRTVLRGARVPRGVRCAPTAAVEAAIRKDFGQQ
jgi:hypothetical protein